MLNGIGSVRCCRRRKGVGVVRSGMIGAWSRASSGGTGSGHRGGTCRVSSVRGRRYGSGTADTPVTAPGIASTRRCWPTPTMPAVSTGRSAWTRRSAVRTSTRRTCPGSQGDLSNYKNLRVELPDHGIGRSRGGLSSKIHQLVDGRGLPLVVVVGPGQAGDAPMFPVLMRHLRVARHGPGRPRWRPDRLRADKAYSSRAIRQHLRDRGSIAVIPEPADQAGHRKRRGSRGGRPPVFDVEDYRGRNVSSAVSAPPSSGAASRPATTSSPSSTVAALS